MRKRVRKPLAFLMALLMTMSVFGSQVMAEDTSSSDAAVVTQGDEGTAGDAVSAEAAADDSGQSAQADNGKNAGQQGAEQTDEGNTAGTSVTEGTAEAEAGSADNQSGNTQSSDAQNSDAQNNDSQNVDAQSADAQGDAGRSDEQVEYVPEEQPDGVSVKAYAAKGTLPDGAVMKVTMLDAEGETADQYDEAAAAMEESNVDYAGFLAMDISFYDADGNEIEPEDGAVNVQFEVDESLLPEDVEADSLAVQHLAETDDGIQVETVADAADQTDGSVAVEDEAVKAEFAVERFSYFTITWTSGYINPHTESIAVYLIDEDGNELNPVGEHLEKFDVSTWSTVTISEHVPYMQNYTYQRAVVASSASAAKDVNAPTYRLRMQESGDWWDPNYTLQYSNSRNGNNKWVNIGNNKVYLIYSKDSSGSTGGGGGDIDVDLPEPKISKKAVSNGDGTYDLSLSVTGSVGSQSSTVNVDVLMIVDESNSMTSTRINNTRTAMKTLIDSLELQEQVDARYSIYTFGNDARDEMSGWQSMPDTYRPNQDVGYDDRAFRNTTVGSAVYRIHNSGEGTNYESALAAASNQLTSARENAITVVVFLSDGEPSMSEHWGNGYNVMPSNSFWAWRETLQTADDIYCDQFYSVGISAEMQQFMGDSSEGYGGLLNAVNAQTKGYYDTDDQGTGLSDIFANIAGSVTNLYIKNVTITDSLNTTNVEQVVGSDGNPTSLEISISDGNPNTNDAQITSTEIAAGSIQASYEKGILKLDFADNYELKPGYTYTVTMKIQPTEQAIEKYAKDGMYPDIPTKGWDTGTHRDETGFYSNKKATLTYEYTENEDATGLQTMEYPMPVVQVQSGKLIINKTITGLDKDSLTNLKDKLQFVVTKQDGTKIGTYDLKNAVKNYDGSYTIKIENLIPGEYTVAETNQEISGYTVQTEGLGKIDIPSGGTATVNITNKYTHEDKTLTVKKIVDGNMGDKSKSFKFELALKDEGGNVYSSDLSYTKKDNSGTVNKGVNVAENNVYAFNLTNGEEITFVIPYGYTYTVTEENGEYTAAVQINGNGTYKDGKLTGKLETNTTVTFTNTKNINAPTGITRAVVPFVVMVIIALGAVVTIIVRRRIRR